MARKNEPQFQPIESIEFEAVKDNGIRSAGASIKDSEDLLIDGVDWGMEHDYEYSITIEARFKDSVLLLLLKDKFPDFLEAEAWMKEHGVPLTRWTWS